MCTVVKFADQRATINMLIGLTLLFSIILFFLFEAKTLIRKQTYHSWFLTPRDNCTKMGLPAEKHIFLQKDALSCWKTPFPSEKCTFLQKNVAFGGHIAGNRKKSQDGFRAQESRTLANFYKKPLILEVKISGAKCSKSQIANR